MDFTAIYFYAPTMKKLLSHIRVALGLKKRVRVATKYEGDSGKTYFYKTSAGVERKLEVFFRRTMIQLNQKFQVSYYSMVVVGKTAISVSSATHALTSQVAGWYLQQQNIKSLVNLR